MAGALDPEGLLLCIVEVLGLLEFGVEHAGDNAECQVHPHQAAHQLAAQHRTHNAALEALGGGQGQQQEQHALEQQDVPQDYVRQVDHASGLG